jgi:hypothetical protein
MFPNNIGSLDRGIRVAVGLALIAAAASGALGLSYIFYPLIALFMATGVAAIRQHSMAGR